MRPQAKPGRRTTAGLAAALVASLGALAVGPAASQGIICCSQLIDVDGGWIGAGRVDDCQGYFNSAPPDILRRLCEQRQYLSCINTARCSELPPGEASSQPEDDEPWPPDPDRDGIGQAFYGPAPAPPEAAPAAPPAMPWRLVYIVKVEPADGGASKRFTVWLDSAGCPLPLDRQASPVDPAAVARIARGKVARMDGHVRVEAEAESRLGGERTGPFAAVARGEDTVAVAEATRAVLKGMDLTCRR